MCTNNNKILLLSDLEYVMFHKRSHKIDNIFDDVLMYQEPYMCTNNNKLSYLLCDFFVYMNSTPNILLGFVMQLQ